MLLTDFRKENPEYDDMDDGALTSALHKKYYSDVDFGEFSKSIGYEASVDNLVNPVFSDLANQQSALKLPDAPDTSLSIAPTSSQILNPPKQEDDVSLIDKIKTMGAGAGQATLGISESIFRTPEAIQRHIETGMNALPVAEGIKDFVKQGNPFGALARGFEGTDITGANVVADEISNAQNELSQSGNFPAFERLSKKGQEADAAFKSAINGDMSKLGSVITDPEAWAGFIGQAAPSLYTAYKSGGSPAFIAWLEGMETASSVADFEKETGQAVSPEEFSQAQIQVMAINTWLEKFGLDKVIGANGKNVLSSMLKGGTSEAATEGMQEFNQNLSQKLSFNENKDLTEGVLPGVMGGAGTGAGGAGIAHVANKNTAVPEAETEASSNQKADIPPAEQIVQALQASIKQPKQQSPYANNTMSSNIVELFKKGSVENKGNETTDTLSAVKPVEAPVTQQEKEKPAPSKLPQLIKLQESLQVNGYENTEELNTRLSDIKKLADEVAYGDVSRDDYNKAVGVKKWAVEFGYDANKAKPKETEQLGLQLSSEQSQSEQQANKTVETPKKKVWGSDIPTGAENWTDKELGLRKESMAINERLEREQLTDEEAEQLQEQKYEIDKQLIDIWDGKKEAKKKEVNPVVAERVTKRSSTKINIEKTEEGWVSGIDSDMVNIGNTKTFPHKNKESAIINSLENVIATSNITIKNDSRVTVQNEATNIKKWAENELKKYQPTTSRILLDERDEGENSHPINKEANKAIRWVNSLSDNDYLELENKFGKPVAGLNIPFPKGINLTSDPQSLHEKWASHLDKNKTDNKNVQPEENEQKKQVLENEESNSENESEDVSVQQAGESESENKSDSEYRQDSETSKSRLEDFGEKLGGSRDDKAKLLKDTVAKEFSDDEIASLPLSKVWPKKSVDEIENVSLAAFVTVARNEIPSKPRVSYKVKRWVNTVKAYRMLVSGVINQIEEGKTTFDDMLERMQDKHPALINIAAKIKLLSKIDRDQWNRIKSASEYPDSYRYSEERNDNGDYDKIPSPHISVTIDGRYNRFDGKKSIDEAVEDVKAILDGVDGSAKSKMKFEIRGRAGKYKINKKGDSEYRTLKSFDDLAKAREYISDNHSDLLQAWEDVKARDNVSKKETRKAVNAPRTGKDHRKGKNADKEMFEKAFGFRGVEFGKWVKQGQGKGDRVDFLNSVYDAFMDLSDILGVPSKALSLNGSLGLGLGSRGSGNASAHFEPSNIVINMTKTKGAGSLAHEWFHALDNYFQRSRESGMGKTRETAYITYAPEPMWQKNGSSLTQAELERRKEQYPESGWFKSGWVKSENKGVRPVVEEAFAELVDNLNQSPMMARSLTMDKGKEGYWSRIIERAARSFENYVIGEMSLRGFDNDYLSNVKEFEDWGSKNPNRYPYLKPEELTPIKESFDSLFNIIETKETEKGVALYSKEKDIPTGLSTSEIEKIIAPVILKWGDKAPKVEVVQSIKDIPEHIVDVNEYGVEHVSAVHYGPEEQIYLVADKLKDKDFVLSRLAHEAVGHHSFEEMMGDDLDQVLERVQWLKKSGDKKLTDISKEVYERYGKLDKVTEAKEIVALVAERGVKSPLLTKVVAAIRKFLRKLGISLKWTATELEALVVAAAKNLETNRTNKEKTERKNNAKQFSQEDNNRYFSREPDEILDDIDEEASNVPTFEDVKDKIKNANTKTRPQWLKLLTRRHLADIGQDVLPTIKTYVLTAEKMDAFRNELVAESSGVAKSWAKWAFEKGNRQAADAMVDTMHAATIAGVDPAEPYNSIIDFAEAKEEIAKAHRAARSMSGEANKYINKANEVRDKIAFEKNRAKAYPALKRQYDKLPKEAKNIYKEVRDHYVERFNQTEQALLDKIDRAELSAKEKSQYKAEMRARFESVRIEGPYFPLTRFGDYWAKVLIPGEWQKKYSVKNKGFTAKDSQHGEWAVTYKEGIAAIETFDSKEEAIKSAADKSMDYEFYMFEKIGQRNNLVKKKERQGFKVKTGYKIEKGAREDVVSEGFIADILSVVDKTISGSMADKAKDEIYQLFLTTLPDMSVRKSFIHRQKTEGFTHDALRAFSHHNFHGAYQLSKLKFADVLQTQIENMEEQARDMSGEKADKAAQILNETKKRHDWAMNPMGAPWANNVTQFNFVWYLGLTPAAAMVNMSQTAIVAYPAMGAKFGFGKAGKELLSASREFMGNRIKLKDGLFSIEGALKGDELKAYQHLVDTGIIDKTLAHDLAAMSETPSAIYSPLKDKTMGVISYAFHHAERFNREVTGIATYRLARKKGMSHDAAAQAAYDMIDNTHFNYSNANKATFMQNDIAKVAFIFKQYSLNMIYKLARLTYQSVKDENSEVKKEARKQLGGILFMAYLFVGYDGMPWLPFGLIDLILEAIWDDEDEPYDIEAERRNFLAEHLGSTWSDVITKGPAEAWSGLGVSDRLSLGDLWLRPPSRDLEMKQEYQYWITQMLGPTFSIGDNWARGISMMQQGHVQRGIETMMPKALKDDMKAIRYADEGVNNFKGDPIIDDVTAFEVFQQAMGFSLGRANKQYDAKSAIKNTESRLNNRRKLLMNQLAIAINNGDTTWHEEIMQNIGKFNRKNPGNAITVNSIKRSLKMRARTSAMTKNGVYLRKNMQHLRDKGRFADE